MSLAIAVLGCGRIAQTHATTLARVDGSVRLAFASRDPARAEAYRRRYKGIAAFGSYEEAITDARVNAVLVATPPVNHLPLTLAALQAGKHAVVEKPAFRRAKDADLVERVAGEVGRQVLVAENYRYKPLTMTLTRLLEANEIGAVRLIRLSALKLQPASDWRASPELTGGGALFEGGVHWVNLLTTLGGEVDAVRGYRPGSDPGPERTMVVVVRFRSGAIGTLHHSWEVPARFKGLSFSQIIGERGTIGFESNGLWVGLNGTRRRILWPGFRDMRGFGAMWRDFLVALGGGDTPRMTLAHARRDLAVIEAAYDTATAS
jgi:UDP-N-acetylglucosamine 3-dehydrogenase